MEVPQKEIEIGRVHTGFSKRSTRDGYLPLYGWDNEFGHHQATTEAFKASDKLISNAAFLEFVLDQGYAKKELWSAEGWNWVSGSKSSFPKFWVNRSDPSVPLN